MEHIKRRKFLKNTVTSGAVLALWGWKGKSQGEAKKSVSRGPNLIIVYPDQMRGQAMGFLDEEPVLTPNLDRFAKDSIIFTHAVANYPVCSPSRAMLMTGKYSHSNHVLNNCTSDAAAYDNDLRADEQCWSDMLKARGYNLGYIGKWHLDSPRRPFVKSYNNTEKFAWNEWTPPSKRHGFGFWYAYGTYDQHLHPMYWETNAPRNGAIIVDEWGPINEAELAIRYVRNEGGKYRDPARPFALVVSMNPPHMPYYQVPQKYLNLYKSRDVEDLCCRPNIPPAGQKWGDYYRKNIKGYYAMISGVDDQFGRILKALESTGLSGNTIVLFTSDHGNCLGIHDKISKNNAYEESMRVPLLIRWPGKLRPRREDLLLSTPDLYPTLLDLMGFRSDIPRTVEGSSHASLLLSGKGQKPTSQLYLWTPLGQPDWGRRGIRTLTHTLIISLMPDKAPERVLFNNVKDPYQMKNIASENPELFQKLVKDELIPLLEKTKDPWLKNFKR